jgi:hypothetical protein
VSRSKKAQRQRKSEWPARVLAQMPETGSTFWRSELRAKLRAQFPDENAGTLRTRVSDELRSMLIDEKRIVQIADNGKNPRDSEYDVQYRVADPPEQPISGNPDLDEPSVNATNEDLL